MPTPESAKNNENDSSWAMLRRLLTFASSEKLTLFWGTIFLVISSVGQLGFPQGIKEIVDASLKKTDGADFNRLALILLVILVVQGLAAALRYFLFSMAGERVVLRLRQKLYSHVLEREMAFFDRHRTGDLISRLSADTTILQNAVSVNVSMTLRYLASSVGGLVLMFMTSALLTSMTLLVIPPVGLAAALLGKRIRDFSKKVQESLGDTTIVVEETLGGIRTVRSFDQEVFEKNRYGVVLGRTLVFIRSRVSHIALFIGGASVIGSVAMVGVLWMGGHKVLTGEMTIGELTQYLIYLMIVAISVGSLGGLWGDYMSALGASRRIFDILDQTDNLETQTGEKPAINGKIDFVNVRFSYPSRSDMEILKGLTLTIEPGQSVALVGSSGAGKSTLAQLLSRFYDIQSGDILFDGISIKKIDPHWLRRSIGMVAQEPILISATIEENIRYGKPEATFDEVKWAAKEAFCEDFISGFPEKYKTLVGERGVQLSGGQKQRVAIARALLKNPKILILDEATSALDAESEAVVQKALQRLMQGRTTLVIAHRLGTIVNAEQILVLDQGRLVERGRHKELIDIPNGIYRRLVEKQL